MKLFFTGDIYSANNRKTFFSESLINVIKDSDIRCCNLEGPVTDGNFISKIGPGIKQNINTLNILKDYGFNMYNLANNHIMDCGKKGLVDTLDWLKDQIFIGAGINFNDAYKEYIYEKDGIKVGFLSFAERGFGACLQEGDIGYAWINHESVEKRIMSLKSQVDFLIINCHIGAEKFEYPLPEIKQLYKKFIDLGADYIIGHHPHIIQGIENYKNGVIFYSLGNTYFDMNIENDHDDSFCVCIEISEKNNSSYKIIPLKYDNEVITIGGNSIEKIKELNNHLNDDKYINEINNFCILMYKNVYQNYYYDTIGINVKSNRSKIKFILNLLLNKFKFNDLFLYHNISIETHRWICERAILNLNNERSECNETTIKEN